VIDLNAHFEKPRIEHYFVGKWFRFSVECRVDGRVAAIKIAPVDYHGFDPRRPAELDFGSEQEYGKPAYWHHYER
jgi:hypothetical protein